MLQLARTRRFSFGAMIAALLFGLCANFFTAAPAMAQTREGASFISGEWRITGSYSDGTSGIDFTVRFSSDGTFVDRDNFRGRWLITGSSFAMFYPDDSQLGYTGVISGNRITGRFEGASTAGSFTMSPLSGGGGGGSGSATLVGGTWRLEGGSWGVGYFDFYSNGRFASPGTAGGSWSQSGSSIYFRFDEHPNSTFTGTLSRSGVGTGNVTWASGADSFRMTRQ